MVSPSVHDGTPNSLLEGMAAGVFPVVGAVESVQEWITDNHNGLVCEPRNPRSIADAIIRALDDAPLRTRARAINDSLIRERARLVDVMPAMEVFYRRVIDSAGHEPALTANVASATFPG
jgi:glycosyltransferase involved in cell wall biosynthesis